jgi:hypothetical protein
LPAPRVRRPLAFALAAIVLSACAVVASVLALDVWLHARYAPWLGYNVWGYRGPVVGRKQAGEYRIAVLGGSAAYGYAVPPTQTISAILERDLRVERPDRPFTAVNLAYNNEGAYSFAFTLRDYAYLDYDLAILYEGYNDLTDEPRNISVFRHQSPVFTSTGYLPIFPLIFLEKAAALRYGHVSGRYPFAADTDKVVFRPSWTERTSADVLQIAATTEAALERRLSRGPAPRPEPAIGSAAAGECADVPNYCQSIAAAVDEARALRKQLLVVTQPYVLGSARPHHVRQQAQMRAMLARRYGGDASVRYVNLGEVVDLADERLSGDRMHTTAAGNRLIAAALLPVIREMALNTR